MQFKLYEMIWMRTIASQMVDSEQKQVSVRFSHGDAVLSASGQTIVFPGFLRAYVEGSDDPEAELSERESLLPPMKKGETIACPEALPTFHETKPPARYTEASLVKKMEELGI
ncbi:MAG: DNA topoisomerase, partial [Bdellovibrionota bacterium]